MQHRWPVRPFAAACVYGCDQPQQLRYADVRAARLPPLSQDVVSHVGSGESDQPELLAGNREFGDVLQLSITIRRLQASNPTRFHRSPLRRLWRASWLTIESEPSTDSPRVRLVLGVEPPLQVALLRHDDELLHHKYGRND